MKKIVLFALSFFTMNGFAQTVLWDGDTVNGSLWNDGEPQVVENPEKDGVNPSDKCIKFTVSNASKLIKIPLTDIKPSFNGSRRVSLMIKKSVNENLQVELSDPWDNGSPYWEKVASWYGGDGKWQKVVFDFTSNTEFDNPGLITITAQTSDVEGTQDVYVDNIQIEDATRVNGQLLSDVADGSLSGDVELTGAWMKGDCQKVTESWTQYSYDDFAELKSKLSASVTSVNMEGAVLKDAYNAFADVNPNILVFAKDYVNGPNVVVDGNAESVQFSEDYAFGTPKEFTSANVTVARNLYAGYNTLVLPFDVTADELGVNAIAKYMSISGDEDKTVTFEKVSGVEANVPVIVDNGGNVVSSLNFSNKSVKPVSVSDNVFKGVYTPMNADGFWGLNGDGKFQKGGEESSLKAFSAYLDIQNTQSVEMNYTTGIGGIELDKPEKVCVYSISGAKVRVADSAYALEGLNKGVYIINNKKYIVK